MFACCDESGIEKGSRWWVIGAAWVPEDDLVASYDAEVTRLRQQTGCWGEIKWTKVAPRWLDVYRRFLALSLGLTNLKFSAIAVDTTLFTTAAMRKFHAEGKREEAYLKFVRMLLRNHLERFAHAGCHDFTILYDQMSVRRDLQRNFRGVLDNDIANISQAVGAPCRYTHLGPVNSASSPLMQATDLVTGAIGAALNRSRDDSKKGEARRVLRADLEDWAGCALDSTANPRRRYDLWEWKPRGR